MFVSLFEEVLEVLKIEPFYLNNFLSCKEFNYVGPDGWFDFNLCDSEFEDVTSSEFEAVTSSNGEVHPSPLLNYQLLLNQNFFSIET